MRVLIVDAFTNSRMGRASFRNFEAVVRSSFRKFELQEAGRAQFIVRNFTRELDVREFLQTFLQEILSITMGRILPLANVYSSQDHISNMMPLDDCATF